MSETNNGSSRYPTGRQFQALDLQLQVKIMILPTRRHDESYQIGYTLGITSMDCISHLSMMAPNFLGGSLGQASTARQIGRQA